MADLLTCDGKGDTYFADWKMQVEKISHLTQHLELQLAKAKAEGIVYKLMKGILHSLTWETLRGSERYLVLMAAKKHASTQMHSRPQVADETLQEYIQRLADLVIQAADTTPLPLPVK